DADIVFDARCLPNPYWEPSLRDANGCDQSVIAFLEHYQDVADMKRDILTWVRNWLPRYQASQRSYLTVAVGCTGGQHRSVYLAESIAAALVDDHPRIRLRHRELGQQRRLDSGAQ
ncbi:MAG: RNase adapter RapZ, partial [Pseudomonadota bacterium]|nr:RNase adapter RapZ [Pseudomonadota bacterium]